MYVVSTFFFLGNNCFQQNHTKWGIFAQLSFLSLSSSPKVPGPLLFSLLFSSSLSFLYVLVLEQKWKWKKVVCVSLFGIMFWIITQVKGSNGDLFFTGRAQQNFIQSLLVEWKVYGAMHCKLLLMEFRRETDQLHHYIDDGQANMNKKLA